MPHTVVLAPGLTVHRVYTGYRSWGRPTPEELRQDFRAVSPQVRPDWDLSRPDLRATWTRGDKRQFYPYKAE